MVPCDSTRDDIRVTQTRQQRYSTETGETVPCVVTGGSLLDLVQWPIESTTTVHVLSPRPDLLNLCCALLVSVDVLPLGRTKTSDTHHGHHGFIVLVHDVHGFSLFLVILDTLALHAWFWNRGDRPCSQPQGRFGVGIFWPISIPRVIPVAVTVIPPLVSSTIISVPPVRVSPVVITIVSPVSF